MKRLSKISKKLVIGLMAVMLAGCSGEKESKENDGSIESISTQINEFFKKGEDKNYKNLTFECKNVIMPEGEYIYNLNFKSQNINKITPTQENIDKLKSMVKGIIDYDGFDDSNFYFWDSSRDVPEIAADDLKSLSEYELCPTLFYCDYDKYKKVEVNNYCIYATKGNIGKYLDAHNAFFGTDGMELVKTYNCRVDDLSDKYQLSDKEMSIKEIKASMEKCLDDLDVCGNKSDKIKEYISEVTVYEIPNENVRFAHGIRTFSYNNIPFRIVLNGEAEVGMRSNETAVMGEAYMLESESVDAFVGLMNTYTDVKETEKYENVMSFDDIVTSVSTYLAGQSVFKVKDISLEYRMFINEDDNIIAVPYWMFETENQTDKSKTIVYVDIKTGETEGMVLRNLE